MLLSSVAGAALTRHAAAVAVRDRAIERCTDLRARGDGVQFARSRVVQVRRVGLPSRL
jgi:hypothetical protein